MISADSSPPRLDSSLVGLPAALLALQDIRIMALQAQNVMAGSSDNFAILFSGGGDPANNHSRYYNSLKGLYEVLVDQRGLAPENVIILYADAGSGQSEFDQSLNQMDGVQRAVGLLRGAGVSSALLRELEDVLGRRTDSPRAISGLRRQEYERI